MNIKKMVKRATKDGRVIIGSKETLKNMGEIEKVILASNSPDKIVKKIQDNVEDAELIEFQGNNRELGSICGKPFNVTTVGIKEKQSIV